MSLPDPLLLERAAQVRLLALDVDGVLTDGRLYFDDAGRESKAFCTRDGLGMRTLQEFGIELALITGRESSIVTDRAGQLGIKHLYQGQQNKVEALEDLLGATGLDASRVCYAGDDWIDLPVLQRVGFSVTVADAEPQVKRRVHWITDNPGGHGAVREICNLIMRAQRFDEQLMSQLLAE